MQEKEIKALKKEYEKVIEDFNKVLKLDPNNALAYNIREKGIKALKDKM